MKVDIHFIITMADEAEPAAGDSGLASASEASTGSSSAVVDRLQREIERLKKYAASLAAQLSEASRQLQSERQAAKAASQPTPSDREAPKVSLSAAWPADCSIQLQSMLLSASPGWVPLDFKTPT